MSQEDTPVGPVLVDNEHLQKLRDIQDTWHVLTKRAGELRFEKMLIRDEIKIIDAEFQRLENSRTQVVLEIQEKYGGPGKLSLETGEFYPDPK